MSTSFKNNRCRVCNKLFCCTNCRDIHEKKKHSQRELNCPLCLSQKLQLNHFDDAQFLCHIVITHLPLSCALCGEAFRKSEDLESIGKCKWWSSRPRRSMIQDYDGKLLPLLATPSPVNRVLSCPEPFVKELSIDSEQGNFTSPPELFRNTSTPMQVGYTGQNFEFKTPKEHFLLKTPKMSSTSLTNRTNNSTQANEDLYETASSSNTHFASLSSCSKSALTEDGFLKSIVPARNPSEDIRTFHELLKNTAGKKLKVMQEQEENCIVETAPIDMELTGTQSNAFLVDGQYLHTPPETTENQRNHRRSKDSIKKVRFSDQYMIKSETSNTCDTNVTENEEYYEAQEEISEVSVRSEKRSLNLSQIRVNHENERNAMKENYANSDQDTKVTKPSSTGQQHVQPRVLMMVVLDNNSSLTTSDLTPLIDSGLRKLEKRASVESLHSSASNFSARIDGNASGCTKRSVTSIDSYVSISSTEFYSTPRGARSSSGNSSASNVATDGISSGGIFSAVAHAMRCAFKSFSGSNTTRNVSREPATRGNNYVLSSLATEPTNSTSHTLSSLATSILQRPGKRPRDVIESSSTLQSEVMVSQTDSRSPIPKRHRGWQKIKGREPIARMKSNQVSSDRGVSSSTQCFQQGSLLVGDTTLPIPSRAHQYTQTD